MKYLFLLSFRSIKANKLRAFIKALIVVFCVAMVTITSGLCGILVELEKQSVLLSLPSNVPQSNISAEVNGAWNVKAMETLGAFFTTLILFIAAWTIYGAFYTDIRERSKLMATLMTVGATDFQKNLVVIAEGLILSAFAIPISILLSIPVLFKLSIELERILNQADVFVHDLFRLDAQAILYITLLALLVIFLSSAISILRVRRLSIVSLARSSSGIEVSLKKSVLDRIMWRVFGKAGELASANYVNQKRYYRHLSWSFSIAISLYVGGSVLIPYFLQLGTPDPANAKQAMLMISVIDQAIRIIPFLAILNAICMFLLSFNARRHEFAIYRSIGMDLKMMHKMIALEWIYRGFYLFLYGMIGSYGFNFAIYSCFYANGIATEILNPYPQICHAFVLIVFLCSIMTATAIRQLNRTNIAAALKKNY